MQTLQGHSPCCQTLSMPTTRRAPPCGAGTVSRLDLPVAQSICGRAHRRQAAGLPSNSAAAATSGSAVSRSANGRRRKRLYAKWPSGVGSRTWSCACGEDPRVHGLRFWSCACDTDAFCCLSDSYSQRVVRHWPHLELHLHAQGRFHWNHSPCFNPFL